MNDMDVLVKWSGTIVTAEWWVNQTRPYPPTAQTSCIADLAAEVRAARETIRQVREKLAAQEPDVTLGRVVREGRGVLK